MTIFHLHSVQWVHKSFNPDNVILFGHRDGDQIYFDWAKPYVVGFDVARADVAHSDKLPSSFRWENRVYVHPAQQRESRNRFHKIFDIYSLGVVLLEIGLLTCFKHSQYRGNPEWTGIPSRQLQRRLEKLGRDLERPMGPKYSEDDDENETRLVEVFRTEVCEKFDQIRL
jgi:serine/threonine protein kinase